MQNLTRIGKRQLFRYKLSSIYLLLFLTWFMSQAIIFLYAIHLNPNISWLSSISDLQRTFDFPLRIGILTYLGIQFVIQGLVILMISYCLLFAFSRTKNNKQTALFLCVLLIAPLCLFFTRLETPFIMALFYPFMNGEKFCIAFGLLSIISLICLYHKKKEVQDV